jgi:hypothetical protein
MPAPAPPPAAAPAPGAPPAPPAPSYILLAGDSGDPPVKITTQEAQRIQEDTGLPPAQLEDNDLRESMQELNIRSAPLTPQDQQALGIPVTPQPQPGTTTVMHQAPRPPPADPQTSMEQQLQSLQNMKEQGLISDDDYNAKKKQVLGI